MIPSIDLMLGTLERVLSVAILPASRDAAATEEASLGILFTQWLRDVVDHVIDAERASCRDCRVALADMVAIASSGRRGPALAALVREAEALLARPIPEAAAEVRDETRQVKSLLGRVLRAARADGDDGAVAVRRRLTALAACELERAIAFGKATGIDPDGAKGRSLAEVLKS